MDNEKASILMLVEGEKTDVNLMEHLLSKYGINKSHKIVSYNTNIYVLYNKMFRDTTPEDIDLLQLLKEHEKDPEKKKIFDENYSDILLIFDLDPQDSLFSADKITHMLNYFVESSDMGKLYLNYPMVEAFYHMKSIPDENYYSYTVSIDELKQKQYKSRVMKENRNHDYRKFGINKNECNTIIKQNIEKAWLISEAEKLVNDIEPIIPEGSQILKTQLSKIKTENVLFVLCTCIFYIIDYNPKLLAD